MRNDTYLIAGAIVIALALCAMQFSPQLTGFSVFDFIFPKSSILLAPPVTIYVDGNLQNDCTTGNYNIAARACSGSNGDAYNTLQEAADVVNPGDTILIRGGTYTKFSSDPYAYDAVMILARSGTPAQPITIKNYNNEHVIVDGNQGMWTYAIQVGDVRWDRQTPGNNFIIDGLEVKDAGRMGIMLQDPTNVIIQNVTVHDNGYFNDNYRGGIESYGGQNLTIQNSRIYHNGQGIFLYEIATTYTDVRGCKKCTIRDNFVYANTRTNNYGNSAGINMRFTEEVTIQGNIVYETPDGGLSGEGNSRGKIIGNAFLHHWQEPGNSLGLKQTVRGGGFNVIAFNIIAANVERGWDSAQGIGDVFINNDVYGNGKYDPGLNGWGILCEGRMSLMFNTIAFNNSVDDTNFITQRMQADHQASPTPPGTRDLRCSNDYNFNLDASSDYNLIGDANRLPNVDGGTGYSYYQPNTINGNPHFANPDIHYFENNPDQVIQPEQYFTDYPPIDGKVSIVEARRDLIARFQVGSGSIALNKGTSLASIRSKAQTALPGIITKTTSEFIPYDMSQYDYSNPNENFQFLQSAEMATRNLNYYSTNSINYADLTGLKDFAGNAIPLNINLDMGAIQSSRVTGAANTCGDGLLGGSEVCDSSSQSCTSGGQNGIKVCNAQCTGYGSCTVTSSAICGNSVIESGETCDGNTIACTSGGQSGTQSCNAQCNGYATCTITPPAAVCGNSVIESGETCDSNTIACTSGGQSGTQSCNLQCNGYNSCSISSITNVAPVLLLDLKFDDLPNDGILDSSGKGNHGQCTGIACPTQSKDRFGVANSAYTFDGSNDYVVLPANIEDTLENFTFTAWVNYTSSAPWQRILDFGDGGHGAGVGKYMVITPSNTGGIWQFTISNAGSGSSQLDIPSTTALPQKTWIFIAVTLEKGSIKMYRNGVLEKTGSITIKPKDLGATNNWIGRSQYPSDPNFTGSLDDIRLYSGAMNASDIQSLYSGQLSQSICGNSILEGTEVCDGTSFGIYTGTCANFNSQYTNGVLACTPMTCTIDTANCSITDTNTGGGDNGGGNGGGHSGGGGGGTNPIVHIPISENSTCTEDWVCGEWNACSSGYQTRECLDANGCNTINDKPETARTCGGVHEPINRVKDKIESLTVVVIEGVIGIVLIFAVIVLGTLYILRKRKSKYIDSLSSSIESAPRIPPANGMK